MAESKKEKILEYKGKPLVRCGKTIYYGSMSEAYVVCLNILSDEDIKGLSAAVENYGNFFAQNCFPASSGVVLIQGTLVGLGYQDVTLSMISSSAFYIAFISVFLTVIQVLWYDRKLKKGGNR